MAGGSGGQMHETSAQIALAQHAQKMMDDYKARWLPVQQQLASQIEAEGTPSSALRKGALGKASTDAAIQFSRAQGAAEKSLSSRGVLPGSGRFDMGLTGMQDDQATSGGLGKVLGEQQIKDAYTTGLTSLMQIGQGQSAEVTQGLTDQARASGLQAQADAQASLSQNETNAGIIGTGLGFGLQQWSSSRPPPVVAGSNPNGFGGTLNNPSAFVGP